MNNATAAKRNIDKEQSIHDFISEWCKQNGVLYQQLTFWHIRLYDGKVKLDIFPKSQKWHNLKTQEEGVFNNERPKLQAILESQLVAKKTSGSPTLNSIKGDFDINAPLAADDSNKHVDPSASKLIQATASPALPVDNSAYNEMRAMLTELVDCYENPNMLMVSYGMLIKKAKKILSSK